jgi:hypothetical protein
MQGLCPNVTTGHIALLGLILDALGAILLAGTDLPPSNKALKRIWPWYKRVTSAGEELRKKRRISKGSHGFVTLAGEILSLEHIMEDETADFEIDEVEYDSIEFDNKDEPIKNKDDIIITVTEKEGLSDSLNSKNRIEWGTASKLVTQEANRKLRVSGALLLTAGFGFLFYGELASLYQLNLIDCL